MIVPFPNLTYALGLCALAGITSHLGYFIKGEHHMQTPRLVTYSILSFIAVTTFQVMLYKFAMRDALGNTSLMAIAYLSALLSSVLIYRQYFHPLRHFHGPKLMGLTKLEHVFRSRKFDNYRQLDEIHSTYGDFVRTGPNELTIFRAAALPILLGSRSRCIKAPWYDFSTPNVSLVTTRDRSFHDHKRRVWDHAFSMKALDQYEPRVLKLTNLLEKTLARGAGQPVEATKLFYRYTFDVMGDVSFDTKFNMLQGADVEEIIETFQAGAGARALLTPVPWLFELIKAIPGAAWKWRRLFQQAHIILEKRLKSEPENPDILAWLIEAYRTEIKKDEQMPSLEGDVVLAIIAGSDTTASALTFLFYHLALEPSIAETLRQELEQANDIRDDHALQGLPYLNGIINETLRLHPPVPGGMPRSTPPEGIVIDDQYIPGGVTCVAPNYTIARMESCFTNAISFVPERWSTAPEMIKDKTAFAPFSLGPYNCVGSRLALKELRLATSIIVQSFDVSLAPGETGHAITDDMQDIFTVMPGPLMLVFKKREGSKIA
ncbi:uncharacterized protein KY384_005156 [Bacidia gigantensis]|uniref:uncharacterized protein n=1 Tax=Bacidia gigantensis TaxID=2732470 RepID=UPI001D055890|nr:uncharacterized protein KY384_005156 [Bacidia gigantensis]KAG8529675.1 hypothetical protein KY384_005156 [Bacidia gigantensis]